MSKISPHWCAKLLRIILKRGLIVIMKTLHTVWYIYIYIIIACCIGLSIVHLHTSTQPNTDDAVEARSNWSFDLLRVEFPDSAKRDFCLNRQEEACCLDNRLDTHVPYKAEVIRMYIYIYRCFYTYVHIVYNPACKPPTGIITPVTKTQWS